MSSSKSIRKKDEGVAEKCVKEYVRLLIEHPVPTKAVTSGVVAAVGNLIAQLIAGNHRTSQGIQWRSLAAFSVFAGGFTGPVTHYFYKYLDVLVPKSENYSTIKRVVIDRLVFAPPFLFLLFYVVAILEGKSSSEAMQKIRQNLWEAIKMNWRIWTVFQYININYIPQRYRVLFANMVSLIWNIYIAQQRSRDS